MAPPAKCLECSSALKRSIHTQYTYTAWQNVFKRICLCTCMHVYIDFLVLLVFAEFVLMYFCLHFFLFPRFTFSFSLFSLSFYIYLSLPDTRYSKAGLYAIFATQSNDFALGYPIVDALYRTTYPEYLQQTCGPQRRTLSILGVVVLQVLTNPIVFMVVVGLVSHFALGQKIPLVLVQFIDGLADSFGGAALFYLTMVGWPRRRMALIVLITAKLLVMPLICKEMVELLDGGAADSSRANHSSLSNFAFLYGVFPTAPNVALYTSQFNMELEVVTSGMVISTFLSAPIMYVSAWLLTIPMMDPILLVMELQNVSFNISASKLNVLLLLLLLLSKASVQLTVSRGIHIRGPLTLYGNVMGAMSLSRPFCQR
uniref:Uncharacterized protein n=1 Tax=Gadus morhua TaxID=8049 RepID=A0A8C5ARF4_GADMO